MAHLKNKPAWNKGLTKQTDERIKQYSKKLSIILKGKTAWNKGKKLPPLTEEHKRKISETNKGRKQTLEHIQKVQKSRNETIRKRGYLMTEKVRKQISNIKKEKYKNGEYNHCGFQKGSKNIIHNPIIKNIIKEKLKGRTVWNKGLTKQTDKRILQPWLNKKRDLKTIEKIRKATIKQHIRGDFPQVNTSIERTMKKVLQKENINFIHQYNFYDTYCCDFALPEYKIIIECDGNYWHNYPYGTTKDKIKNGFIKHHHWSLLRFWENDINNNIEKCINIIKNKILEKIERGNKNENFNYW